MYKRQILDVAKHAHNRARQKRDGARRRAGHDSAIDRSGGWRPTPYFVAVFGIGSGNAPQIVTVIRKFAGQTYTKTPVYVRSKNRILKIIGVLVALSAKIEPGLGILVNEERRVGADVTNGVEFESGSLPRVPGLRRERMGRGTQAQQVHHHHFAVAVPAILQESAFGSPTVGKNAGVFGKPVPIDAIKNLLGELAYLGMLEILPAGENSTKQNGSIDGRHFRLPQSFTGADVGPVVIKDVYKRQAFG